VKELIVAGDIFNTPMRAGVIPDLVRLLWEEYRRYVEKALNAQGDRLATVEEVNEALKKAPALSFLAFAHKYLNKYRVVENFAADANHGINNARIIVKLYILTPQNEPPSIGNTSDVA